jgi:penicillin-binding protein 1A
MSLKKILAVGIGLIFVAIAAGAIFVISLSSSLPQMIKIADYKPLLVSDVYARGGEKLGEFYNENRTVVPYAKIPKHLVQAFVAAEDDTFFRHGGIDYFSILRAFLINLKAGHKRQGASTITQQVSRSLLLNPEKSYIRKIREILLAYKMEEHLSKEEILFLYLNQIYFGEGAYGISSASERYFRKPVEKLTLAESAILAGLPQAPSAYSPVDHPAKAKDRQRYVLNRMATVKFITEEQAKATFNEPVTVYMGKEYKSVAPHFVEILRQLLIQELGETAVLNEGLRIYTSLDYKAQQEAQNDVRTGLRELDKRQGYRGAAKNLATPEEQQQFLINQRKHLVYLKSPMRTISPDGKFQDDKPFELFHKKDNLGRVTSNLPDYISKNQILEAIVTKVDDTLGLTFVKFAETQGIIDISDMGWARKINPSISYEQAPRVSKPSQVFKPGDVIEIKVTDEKFNLSTKTLKELTDRRKQLAGKTSGKSYDFDEYTQVSLEQAPAAEASLLSFDQSSGEVIAMVGGYEFKKNENEFNRALQAKRQTGSSFKSIVYAAALDKGFTPATPILDAPIVYDVSTETAEGQQEEKTWKPQNHGNKFAGDILFRNALVRSLNIPTIKILEKIGVSWVTDYARRLGIFSSLNPDLSLGLGSSSVTLFEMTKVFSNIGRLGKRIRPIVIHRVLDKDGKVLIQGITLDKRFEKETSALDTQFEEKRKTVLESKGITSAEESQKDQAATDGFNQLNPGAANSGSGAGSGAGTGLALSPEELAKRKTPALYFADPDQLISPQTAYVMTTLLTATVNEEGGTGGRARALGRPVAGKTGTTNGYFDAWFLGFTPQIVTGVWVGFDSEKTLGPGEVGGRAALPIWLEYMKYVHQNLPIMSFSAPPDVVYANIDNQTGKLASASSKQVVNQAFIRGTEPRELNGSSSNKDDNEFLKEDLTE